MNAIYELARDLSNLSTCKPSSHLPQSIRIGLHTHTLSKENQTLQYTCIREDNDSITTIKIVLRACDLQLLALHTNKQQLEITATIREILGSIINNLLSDLKPLVEEKPDIGKVHFVRLLHRTYDLFEALP